MEVSKAIIRIKKTSRLYSFFHFVICVVNIIRCNPEYNIENLTDIFKTEEYRLAYNILLNKFGSPSDYSSIAFTLSGSQVVLLLRFMEIIAQELLVNKTANFKTFISNKLFLTEDWVADFFSGRQFVMETLKEPLQNIPLYHEILNFIKDIKISTV